MSEPTESSVRAEVRAWLEANWNPDYGLVEWRTKLIESGWGAPHWPKQWYGRDLPVHFNTIVDDEFARIGAVGVAKAGIRTLAAATILAHGTDFHKEKFLRRILTGEDTWCQLFSEPGSGSDVAGAVTRAEMKGNKWIVNGQKVWTTSAHHAHWGLLLARTDWDQTKHKGLSYFIIDMHQPGVNVQPLKQMNGHASFNQVFLTDAVVEPEFLVANVGDGWAVTTTTLMHERRGADGLRTWAMGSDRKGRIYDEERAEIATTMEPYKWYPQRAGRVDLILQRAKETGHLGDPVVRQEIAKLMIMSKAAEWTARRARAAAQQGKLEAMYKKMYDAQSQWGEKQDPADEVFRGFAVELGLDMTAFDKAYSDPATAARVQLDVADGRALGVQGTPTFFLNGERIQPHSYEDLTALFDQALAE